MHLQPLALPMIQCLAIAAVTLADVAIEAA